MKNPNYFYIYFLFIGLTVNAQWQQIGNDINGEAMNDASGWSVSLSSDGSIIAIGAQFNSENGLNSGHVRVFRNNSGIWQQIGNDINGELTDDNSGSSVSLSSDGSTIAIGAYNNDGNGSGSGHVRIFQNNSGAWQQVGNDIDGEAEGDNSGSSVSLSSDGSVVAIGAPNNNGNGNISGHVRVFKNNSGTWQQIGNDINGESSGDQSGWSISLNADGSVIAIGTPWNNENGTHAGHVRVFQNNSGTWQQIGNDIDGDDETDYLGYSVSLNANGNIVAIGAPYGDANLGNEGHVKVFKNNSGTWQQIGNNISGEGSGDTSGWSVSLSADGSVIAIGAPWNDENGTNAGHVRVFENNSGSWQQRGLDIDGEAIGNHFGYSVSLSSDGSAVAIGAPYYNFLNSYIGVARVFKDASLGVLEIQNHQDISIYPNPTNHTFFVKSKKSQIEEITVSDITGKKIFNYTKSKIVNNGFKVDLSNLESSIYIVSIKTDKRVVSTKIIKI